MLEIAVILSKELTRLLDDYYSCNDPNLRALIHSDIQLLSKALMHCELPV